MKDIESSLCLLAIIKRVTDEEWIEKGFFRVCKSILGIDTCNKILRKTVLIIKQAWETEKLKRSKVFSKINSLSSLHFMFSDRVDSSFSFSFSLFINLKIRYYFKIQ
jgi:hypothetical protein